MYHPQNHPNKKAFSNIAEGFFDVQ